VGRQKGQSRAEDEEATSDDADTRGISIGEPGKGEGELVAALVVSPTGATLKTLKMARDSRRWWRWQ